MNWAMNKQKEKQNEYKNDSNSLKSLLEAVFYFNFIGLFKIDGIK